jgi:hypothetical protein
VQRPGAQQLRDTWKGHDDLGAEDSRVDHDLLSGGRE